MRGKHGIKNNVTQGQTGPNQVKRMSYSYFFNVWIVFGTLTLTNSKLFLFRCFICSSILRLYHRPGFPLYCDDSLCPESPLPTTWNQPRATRHEEVRLQFPSPNHVHGKLPRQHGRRR